MIYVVYSPTDIIGYFDTESNAVLYIDQQHDSRLKIKEVRNLIGETRIDIDKIFGDIASK